MNKIIITGNLVKDPEYTTTANGIAVCKFTLAVNRKYKKEDGSTETDFINCVAWRNTADYVSKYAHKGNRLGIIGSLQTRSYDAQDGSKRYVTEVLVDEVELYTSKQDNDNKPKTDAQSKQEIMQGFEPINTDDLPF